ncbi:hypothetical protein M3182_16560 [Mesobacillus maritimus]|uniref:DUF6602 domain-containing protein n=1 Tax=Mesobacillus maritimus TaxID=1643336 RepID=UPI00203E4956|nr:DUF6602 domain-containing protein [Mesobacillus maritimus]MCM3587351.1 hypothetical protein [Mesobacillus maritimus]
MSKYLYNDYIIKLAEKFNRIIDDISADFNFDYGFEFEIVICKALRKILPNKYGICRGHVVSRNGEKQGDDIIIFDQERFPTLKANDKEEYFRKENIPIEAVYGYIEAKHTLNPKSLDKAFEQITAVKELIMKRPQMNLFQNDPYINDERRVGVHKSEDYPLFRNPVFCIILSRYATTNDGKRAENSQEIHDFLQDRLTALDGKYRPELIVAGKSNFLGIGYKESDGDFTPTLFTLNECPKLEYENLIRENLSFGIALAQLLSAIDWIRLGRMPWEEILNDAIEEK